MVLRQGPPIWAFSERQMASLGLNYDKKKDCEYFEQ